MRRPASSFPSFSLHHIAAAMSTHPPFRGGRGRGRGRRSFSGREPTANATSAAVSGDSHFQSVRDTNSSFQHRHNNINDDYVNNNNSRNFNPRYANNNNNGGLRFPPQTQSYKPRPPSFNRRPDQPWTRAADYRIWESAKHRPPPHLERFVVLSYNILADYLANSHGNLYFHIPPRFMSWDWRKGNILFELARWSPDIMCFQEVDKFHELEEDLRHHGYSGIWKMRTGKPIDGCAVFWRTSRFKLVYEECIEFNKLGMRDNVAQICVLESIFKNHTDKRLTSSESTEHPNRVVICNIHVLYNPRRGEIKLGQVRVLLERAEAISKNWNGASVVLCGDFNCTPKSPLYNFISEQKLDISELERDKVSGQAAAVLHPPPRQFGYNARGQSSGNIASSTMTQNISVDGKQNTSIENQHASESILGNLPTVYNHSINSSMVSEEASVKTSHNVEDPSKENDGSLVSVSIGNLRDEDHSGHTDKSTDDVRSAQSAEQLASESEQDPEVTSSVAYTEKGIGSGFSPEEHVLKDILTSEENKRNCSNDILSPSIDDSINKCGEEDTRNSCNTNNYQSGSNCNISCSESAVSDMPSHVVDAEAKPGPTNVCVASEANKLSFKNDIDKKLIGLSLNGMDESVEDNEGLVEDAEEFMSDLNNDGDPFPSNLGDMVVEYLSSTPKLHAVDVNKPSYDPSMWTPIEIATATGNANNTNLEHSLKLTSTYTEVEDYSGTRDSNGEPLVTSYNTCFMGTVDYIWRSEGLRTVKVLAPISKDVMQATGGFPTKKWGSDHIALASELAFTK